MAITVVPPLAAPINVVAVESAGGTNVPVDTYYIRVVAANHSSYSCRSNGNLFGIPSAEISITTTTLNNKIDISWDAVPSATHYNVYVKRSGEANWVTTHCYVSSNLAATTATNSFSMTTISNRSGAFDTFAYNPTYALPGNIDRELGMVDIYLTGAHGSLRIEHITDALDTAGLSDYYMFNGSEFILKGTFRIDGAATGTFAAYYPSVATGKVMRGLGMTALGGFFKNSASGFAWNWGVPGSLADSNSCDLFITTWSERFDTSYMNLNKLVVRGNDPGNRFLSQSYIAGGDNYMLIGPNTGETFGLTLRGIIMQYSADLSDINSDSSVTPLAGNLTISNSVMAGWGITSDYTGTATIRDCNIYPSWFNSIRPRQKMSGGIFFVNSNFYDSSGTLLSSPIIYWDPATSGITSVISLGVTVAMRVSDSAGPVENATVTAKDKDGNELFSVLTDASGDIVTQDIFPEVGTYGSGTGHSSTTNWTEKYPIVIRIKKDGYLDESVTVSRLSSVNTEILLKPYTSGLTLVDEVIPGVFKEL